MLALEAERVDIHALIFAIANSVSRARPLLPKMDANARRQIEYAKKRLRRKYRGPDLTSGALTVGKCYQLTRFGIGDDFTNVGASAISLDRAGEIFKATGTTPATWSNGSVLNEIAIADLTRDADTVFEAATETVTMAYRHRPSNRTAAVRV